MLWFQIAQQHWKGSERQRSQSTLFTLPFFPLKAMQVITDEQVGRQQRCEQPELEAAWLRCVWTEHWLLPRCSILNAFLAFYFPKVSAAWKAAQRREVARGKTDLSDSEQTDQNCSSGAGDGVKNKKKM